MTNRKWIITTITSLILIGFGSFTASANANHQAFYHNNEPIVTPTNSSYNRNIKMSNGNADFTIRGRVTLGQLLQYLNEHPIKGINLTSAGAIVNNKGQAISLSYYDSAESGIPLTLQHDISMSNHAIDVKNGKNSHHTNAYWFSTINNYRYGNSHIIPRGKYYIAGNDDSSIIFYYGKHVIGSSNLGYGFTDPFRPGKDYKGARYQLIKGLQLAKAVPPKGYVVDNSHSGAYRIITENYKYAQNFDIPVVRTTKIANLPIPINYNENGDLVNAHATIKNPAFNGSKLEQQLSKLKLSKPTKPFKVNKKAFPSLRIDDDGNEYVNIPTNGPVKPIHLHWAYIIRKCGYYKTLNSRGTLEHQVGTLHPGRGDTFHLDKAVITHDRNGNKYLKYRLKINGGNYWVTGNKYYTRNAYIQPFDFQSIKHHNSAMKVIRGTYTYRSKFFTPNKRSKYLKTGTIIPVNKVKKIIRIGYDGQYRFMTNRGNYFTANKNCIRVL